MSNNLNITPAYFCLDKGPKFPVFADHPTPVNVSVKPLGPEGTKTKAPAPQSSATHSHESFVSADVDGSESTSSCCAVS